MMKGACAGLLQRLPSSEIAAVLLLLIFTGPGCRSVGDVPAALTAPPCPYPDVLLACDNPNHLQPSQRCAKEDRGDASMTIGFYEYVQYDAHAVPRSGRLLFRLRDHGHGIPCKIIEYEGKHWVRVELSTGQIGYIDQNEPAFAVTPFHWGPCSSDEP